MVDLGVGRSADVAAPPVAAPEVAVPRPARPAREAPGRGDAAASGAVSAARDRRATATAEAAERREAREALDEPVETLNHVMESLGVGLRFRVNEDLNELFVQVVNEKDGSVVRQIPPEEMVQLKTRFREAIGLLLDRYA